MEDDHTEESSDGTLARGDDHSNYTHKQEYVEVIDAVDELKEPDYSTHVNGVMSPETFLAILPLEPIYP